MKPIVLTLKKNIDEYLIRNLHNNDMFVVCALKSNIARRVFPSYNRINFFPNFTK